MAIDYLHDRIRKLKNPSMIDFCVKADSIPSHILEEEASFVKAYGRFCCELMTTLKDIVPAVRLSYGLFSLMGTEGLDLLKTVMQEAKKLGFYLLLDAPEITSPWLADNAAQLLNVDGLNLWDGLLISPYIGSDGVKPFLDSCKNGKDLFVIVRSPNKSAAEIQDLLTGTRHVYDASAEMVSRFASSYLGKCGYSNVGGLVSAGAPECIRTIRAKHNRVFLVVDGLDYPSGNAKNCSYAFDRFGYGGVVCSGPSVTAAWKEEGAPQDYLEAAQQAALRMKKNITRYIDIL